MRDIVSVSATILELKKYDLLPTILFRSSRAQCDFDVQRLAGNRKLTADRNLQREIKAKINEVIEKYDFDRELIISHAQYASLVTAAAGAHHAGQLLMWRLLLEELMSAGLLKALIATGTVAAGVDFPARSVIVSAHSRRGNEGFEDLTSAELQQMSGRAGRRGKDTVGFCIAVPSKFCDARTVLKIAKRPPEALKSSYFPGPSTVLNLLRYRTADGLSFTVERSLASYKDKEQAQKLIEQAKVEEQSLGNDFESRELDKDEKKKVKKIRRLKREADVLNNKQVKMLDSSLEGLNKLGFIVDNQLSEKGVWSSNLCTNLVIELAELIDKEMITAQMTLEEIVAVVASIAGDYYRSYLKIKGGYFEEEQAEKIQGILKSVRELNMPGVGTSLEVVEDAAYTAVKWIKTESWQEFKLMLISDGVAEGDAARLITQTAEQLNQIARLARTHKELADRAFEARLLLLRPPLTEVVLG